MCGSEAARCGRGWVFTPVPPRVRDGEYWGIDVHYAARLCAAAHGGQVLVSDSTAALVDADFEDLGRHALKDFPSPRTIFQFADRWSRQ